MTTAAGTLITKPGARIAFVCEIEGHDVVYTDVNDLTTWTGYTVRPGLQMHGTVTRNMDLLGFSLQPVGFGFELVDAIPWDTTNSLAKLLAHLDEAALVTELRANMDRDDTTALVLRTTHFPASGVIHIGHERITYSGKTQTGTATGSFTGCTRGTLPTSASSAASPGTWAHTHKVGTEAGPEVANKHRIWKNRMVTIYAVGVDPDTGTWNSRANSLNELVGLIEDYGFNEGKWQFSCTSIEKRLQTQLLRDQYQGTISGLNIGSTAKVKLHIHRGGSSSSTTATASIPAGTYTPTTLIAKINDLSRSMFSDHYISFSIFGDGRVGMTAHAGIAGDYTAQVWGDNAMGMLVMRMLGWDASGANSPVIQHYVSASGAFTKMAGERPMVTYWSPVSPTDLSVVQTSGAWADQNTDDLPTGDGNGYVMIEDSPSAWQVSRSGDTLTWIRAVDLHGRPLVTDIEGGVEIVRRLGEDPNIGIKQIWIVKSPVSRLLLRMILSTGTTNYNDSTYDKWPDSMGAGLPANLVDIPSFEAIGEQLGASGQLFQVLLQPEGMATHLESLMCTFGFHIVWRSVSGVYKLVATVPTTIANLTPSFTLDDSNTGSEHGTVVASGADLVRNRLTLRYNREPASGEFLAQDTYDNLSAMSEQDEPSSLSYDALALYDYDGTKLQSWRRNVAAPMCAYFARPIRKYTRSGSRGLWFVSIGDVVLFSDPDAPSASTGAYGIDEVKAWVVAITKNYDTYEIDSIELLVPPGKAYRYAPSAMLDYTRGDFGYDNANRRLFLRNNEFTRASGARDVTYFLVGDRIHIHEVDPATGAMDSWEREVQTVGIDYLQVTVALSAPAFNNDKRYYVTLSNYADALNVTARSVDDAGTSLVTFLADTENQVDDGGSGIGAFLWGSHLPDTDAGAAPTGDEHYRLTRPNSDALPASYLRDAAYAVNNCFRHVTNQHPIAEHFTTVRSTNSTSYVHAAGPYKVFCPPGVEQLVFSLDAFVSSGTGTFRVTCSSSRPTGASTTVVEFGPDAEQVENTTTATSLAKVAITANIRPTADGYTYVTVEFKHSAGGAATTFLRGVSAYFAARAVA